MLPHLLPHTPTSSASLPPGPRLWPPWRGQATQQPGSALSESGEVWGGGEVGSFYCSCLIRPTLPLPPASWLLVPSSCLLPLASYLLPLVSEILHPHTCLLTPALYFLPPASFHLPPANLHFTGTIRGLWRFTSPSLARTIPMWPRLRTILPQLSWSRASTRRLRFFTSRWLERKIPENYHLYLTRCSPELMKENLAPSMKRTNLSGRFVISSSNP